MCSPMKARWWHGRYRRLYDARVGEDKGNQTMMMGSAAFDFKDEDDFYTVIFRVAESQTLITVKVQSSHEDRSPMTFPYPHRTTGYTKAGSAKVVHGRANPNQTNARYWIKEYRKKHGQD